MTQAQGSTGIGYGISVANEFSGESPVYGPDDQETIMSRMQRWEDVLQFPSIERQAELLRSTIPWDVLEYAWQDHPEWLPQDCPEAEAARNKVTSGYRPPSDDNESVPTTGTLGRRGRQATPAEDDAEVPPRANIRGRQAPAMTDDAAPAASPARTRTRAAVVEDDVPSAPPRGTRRDSATDATVRGRAIPDDADAELEHPQARTRTRAAQAAEALQRARARM